MTTVTGLTAARMLAIEGASDTSRRRGPLSEFHQR